MRITKDNINNIVKYMDKYPYLSLSDNKYITHIDYIPDNIKWINMSNSNIEEITCKLPEGLLYFYCYNSNLKSLPLLPKSLRFFDGRYSNLPKEFQVDLYDNEKCNQLRKLQMINSL